MENTLKLIETLEQVPKSKEIQQLIKLAQNESSVDISKLLDQLMGVWELRWSSSKSPLLNFSPLLDNFQIFDPGKGRAFNLFSPKGLLG